MITILAAAVLAICPPGPRDNCVTDGDTFWHRGEKIRIANIDAPEIAGKCPYERDLARKATMRLSALLGRPFAIHRAGTDRYGRTLATITVDGRDVGAQLVREGLAREWGGRREPWC